MMNCQQATRLMSDAQDRELPLKDKATLKLHVLMCSGCRNFGKHMGSLRDIVHTYAKGSGEGGGGNSSQRTDDTPRSDDTPRR